MDAHNLILVADDDKNICELLRLYLEKDGYKVKCVFDGQSAVDEMENYSYSALILDIMMPKLDGMEVLKKIRQKTNVPVIMLTAKGETVDKVLGLEFGADDYMVKPFEPKELLARLKAVLRRTKNDGQNSEALVFDNLFIDKTTYELKINDESIDVPPKEFELLAYLCSHANKVYTRDQLLNEVWGYDYFGDSRTVDVHIKRLREKIDGASEKWTIRTIWGVGYKFEVK